MNFGVHVYAEISIGAIINESLLKLLTIFQLINFETILPKITL